ncbi:unnamed protein product [Linum tenue]|uniref:Uncharacterized protein n=1 Tax=Linum tenue TaxID=586396 RepID=A0AAV0IXY3_9ROSI|nr:unnamed protein product [Linum tenue]
MATRSVRTNPRSSSRRSSSPMGCCHFTTSWNVGSTARQGSSG